MDSPTDLLAHVLREYRRANGMEQADLAQMLHLDQSHVSRIETGQSRTADVEMLLHIAHRLDLPLDRVGLSDEMHQPVPPPSESTSGAAIDPVTASQASWRRTRHRLNRSRGELAEVATSLYPPEIRIDGLTFMARPEWMPDGPIPLDDVRLEWTDEPVPPGVTGAEPEARAALPLRTPDRRFACYTAAIRHLDRPRLFENRTSYRLLAADLRTDPGLTFGLGTYFDKLDVGEAVAHELATAHADTGHSGEPPTWDALPLRALVADPFDLRRRLVLPAIETLTLCRERTSARARFLLHWRDPAKVATSGGIHGLIPAGEFQPSTVATHDRGNDFSLWRSMVREYSEELLGEPERTAGSGKPLDYGRWNLYRDLTDARERGAVAPYCLGIGLDTLTLTPTVLTVTVFDSDVFRDLFGETIATNEEGSLVGASGSASGTDGLPFDEESVMRLLAERSMSSPGSCILQRAWRFRERLLRSR